jgi:hypothetical protein
MAFLHYLQQNSYTIIDGVLYHKEGRSCSFRLSIYADITKKEVLAYKEFSITGSIPVQAVISMNPTEEPSNPTVGDAYYIPKTCDFEPFSHYKNMLAIWQPVGPDNTLQWQYWFLNLRQRFYDITSKVYYAKLHNMDDTPEPDWNCWEDVYLWNDWLSKDILFNPANETNLYKQIYLFLKTRPAFANCVDA